MNPRGRQLLAEFIYCAPDPLKDKEAIQAMVGRAVQEAGFHLVGIHGHQFDPVGATVVAIIGESHIAVHTYPEARHATIDVFTCSAEQNQYRLLEILEKELSPETVRVVEVQRGNPIEVREQDWMTEFSTKGFDVRYHVAREIFRKRSRYQKIDIVENEDFGRMLFLDNDLQIAERDAHLYNRAMVAPLVREGRRPGTVAILGGGDGGVLHELLRHGPDKVYLVDIDAEVIRAAEAHLPAVCNGGFRDPRVEVVIGDAGAFLQGGREFDGVIYDLTMHPESFTDMDRSVYLDRIFRAVRASLRPGGTVSLQCCSEFDEETRGLLGPLLRKAFGRVHFTKTFIPSFCERWVFAWARVD